MTASRRWAVAGVCTAVGILAVWALQHAVRNEPLPRVIAAPLRAERAAGNGSVLWVLTIGVSHYRATEFNLQFAEQDARAIAAALQHQSGGAVYSTTHVLVLTDDQVTRESILASMERLLAQAGPDDVIAIFLAGHGVRDRTTGSYYFLPFSATADNLLTVGLRTSDFDELVRVMRRNVRGVVLMLDTCHAGAFQTASPEWLAADDLATRMSAGEGFFLLAATRPGEESKEKPELEHGAFTYALLEGLQGAADADGDGLLSVSDLFGYVARRVPLLTGGAQHPYHKVEGTDLVFAAVVREGSPLATSPALPTPADAAEAMRRPTRVTVNTVGVIEFRDLRADPQHDWIGKALRVALNTQLSKVRALRVYAPELIDRTAASGRSDHLATAQRLGIRKLLTGSYHVVGKTLRIDAEIVDTSNGVQEGSDSVEGNLDDFFALQKTLVLSMLRRLRVEVSPEEGTSIQGETNTDVDAYRLLLEGEGLIGEPTAAVRPTLSPPPPGPQSHLHRAADGWAWIIAPAYAEESAADLDASVRQLLDAYRRAHEEKSLERLATLYTEFSERQREAQHKYLDNADQLTVEVTDITIEPHDQGGVLVTFTRRDRFVDHESGKPVRLEVRLSKVLVREGNKWKIAR